MKKKLHEIIFEADTPAGKAFDIILILCVLASVGVVLLDSVESINKTYGKVLGILEWIFTILFSLEYILRLYAVRKPLAYARSFFGIVDLLAVLPTYIGLFLPVGQYFVTVRILRILRVFRVFKLTAYIQETRQFMDVIKRSGRKILVFLLVVFTIVVMMGALMYVIEGPAAGFTSIPRGIYWAIVTLTTVGYGDIHPQTGFGQALAAVIMILGYSLIVVPTGFVTVAAAAEGKPKTVTTQACPSCVKEGHDADADYCKYCGALL